MGMIWVFWWVHLCTIRQVNTLLVHCKRMGNQCSHFILLISSILWTHAQVHVHKCTCDVHVHMYIYVCIHVQYQYWVQYMYSVNVLCSRVRNMKCGTLQFSFDFINTLYASCVHPMLGKSQITSFEIIVRITHCYIYCRPACWHRQVQWWSG